MDLGAVVVEYARVPGATPQQGEMATHHGGVTSQKLMCLIGMA